MVKILKTLTMAAIALLVLASIVLISIALVTQYDKSLRDVSTTSVNTITVAAVGTVTSFGATVPYVQSVTGCINASDAAVSLTTGNYSVYEGTSTGGGIIVLAGASDFVGETVNCSTVTYLAANSISTQSDKFITGIGVFAIFVSVFVLALVGRSIYKLFIEK